MVTAPPGPPAVVLIESEVEVLVHNYVAVDTTGAGLLKLPAVVLAPLIAVNVAVSLCAVAGVARVRPIKLL